ncbi:MAG: sulfatase-like hydrolase/transferase, partial [Cyclobacteriaceae bacterium]|nr:sulfatase-like hydrolase/transferase [Cyclobacteriaceae bacterium SS2]
MAEVLNKQGYKTGIVGKWHVAPHYKRYKGWSPTLGPRQQGFGWAAETFGSHPYGYVKGEDSPEYEDGEFPVDSLTENAIRFLEENRENSDPFFLYVSHYYVHTPLSNHLEWLIEKYRKKAGNNVSEAQIKYAAFVETMDHYVGQLLDAVDELGLRENTLVVFTSDNGGHPDHAFNRPLRGSKWHLYEGGIRVPMMVRWPGHVEPGAISAMPVIQTDLLPTFQEAAGGVSQNDELDGKSLVSLLNGNPSLEDRSLFWHFPYYHPEGDAFSEAGEKIGVEDGHNAKTFPQSAIRKGKHKLLYFYEDDRAELYDLEKDIRESEGLSIQEPELAESLKTELFDYLESVNARFPKKK